MRRIHKDKIEIKNTSDLNSQSCWPSLHHSLLLLVLTKALVRLWRFLDLTQCGNTSMPQLKWTFKKWKTGAQMTILRFQELSVASLATFPKNIVFWLYCSLYSTKPGSKQYETNISLLFFMHNLCKNVGYQTRKQNLKLIIFRKA